MLGNQLNLVQQKILYIEDDPDTSALVAEELTERGYEIHVAYNGQEGLSSILRNHPNLVICDISMPVMSGFELLEKLTAIAPRFNNMPFIFLTALIDREIQLKGRQLGADDFVTKPIDFDVLSLIIKARLARVARNDIWSQAIVLTEREIDTLTWSARGKTSSEIAMIIGLTKRTVDFHIENARRKLDVATRTEAVVKAASGGLIDP